MLPRENRLRDPVDFRTAFRTGVKGTSGHALAHLVRTRESHAPRVGFVVSKAVGNAVTRNLVKRRARAWAAEHLREMADGELLVSLGADGTVRLWTGIGEAGCTPGQVLDTTAVRPLSIALSPDGRTLAVCGTAGAPQLWDVETSTLSSEVEGVEFAPRAVAYAADSTLLIGSGIPETSTTSSPERARLYALGADGTLEEGPVPEGLDVSSIAVDSEGTRIAVTGRNERRVMIWDRGTGDREDLPDAPGGLDRLAWAPDCTTLHGISALHGVVSFDGTAWTTFDLP
mgnify:CR=1 FL=1